MKRALSPLSLLAASVGLAGVVCLATPSLAFAAGSGYTPTPGPAAGGTASGLAGTVISSTTIQPSGGTATGTIGNATITATVKAGTFTGPVQLVITNASSSAITPTGGGTPVVTFGIGVFENGTKVSTSFSAITVTVTSPSITAGSTVDFVTSAGLQVVSGTAVTNGSATFTFTSDPTVEVVAAATTAASATSAASTGSSGATIAGATSGQTGKPFLLEEMVAVGLIALGVLLLVGLRLRRRPA